MSEEQDVSRAATNQAVAPAHGKLTLTNALIILVILYLVTGVALLFATSRVPSLVTWLEAGQWFLVILWLFVGVYPPFMRWRKQARERNKQ